MTGFFVAPRVVWGPGAVEQLSGLGARRALLVVDRDVVRRSGHRRVAEELAKSDTVTELVEVGPDADRIDEVERLSARLTEFAGDWAVAIGGGRTLDAAKAARALASQPGLSVATVTPMTEFADPPKTRLVAIPTTSGSGSEASWNVDLRTPDGEPRDLAHRAFIPEWAVLDHRFAASLSNEQRSDGAMEALGQAVEAYLSAWSNPFSDADALSVVRTVFERLPHAVKWSDDPDAAEELHYAASLAGLAASNAQRGVAHALARALSLDTGLSYGRLVGIVLPYVLDFDQPSARDRLEALGGALRRPDETSALSLAVRLRRLQEVAQIPSSLSAAGVPAERIHAAREVLLARALRAPGVLANPRVPSPSDLESLFTCVTSGRPSA